MAETRPQNLNDVEGLETRTAAWLERTDAGVADRYVQDDLTLLRDKHTFNNLIVLPDEALAKAEQELRHRYDETLAAHGIDLDRDLDAALRQVEAEIARDEHLPAEEATYREGTFDRLMAENVSAAAEDRVRARMAGKTRRAVLDLYAAADATTLHGRALLHVVEGGLDDLSLVPAAGDPQTLMDLREAIAARRAARVPAWKVEARARLQKLATSLTRDTKLRHLRAECGIAVKAPKQHVQF